MRTARVKQPVDGVRRAPGGVSYPSTCRESRGPARRVGTRSHCVGAPGRDPIGRSCSALPERTRGVRRRHTAGCRRTSQSSDASSGNVIAPRAHSRSRCREISTGPELRDVFLFAWNRSVFRMRCGEDGNRLSRAAHAEKCTNHQGHQGHEGNIEPTEDTAAEGESRRSRQPGYKTTGCRLRVLCVPFRDLCG